MNLIDTHSHIYLPEFDEDRQKMMKAAEKEGVRMVFMPAIDSSTHSRMIEIEEEFLPICRSMMGLHPCSVKENYQEELQIVNDYLKQREFIAIGEIGLDFYWDLTYKTQQYGAFQQQIRLALQHDIPIVIHSRNSIDECISVIKEHQKAKLKGVFHCFSGTIEQARKIIDLDFYLGIGGVVTFKNSGLDKVMDQLTLDNIILETDAPYLAPVPFRGKRNECSYLKYVVQKIAEIKKIEPEMIAEITTANAEKLFGL
jgi:TatD DNase family protein